MIVVVSGEGPSDIGNCATGEYGCIFPDFNIGPMTWLLDGLIEQAHGYSPLAATPGIYRYFSESAISERAQARKREKRYSLAGKKHGVETGYFYINAWMLADIAKELEEREGDVSMAVLFRDTDGTNSSPRDIWERKYTSMLAGFERAEYERGVPMMPRPKSEAWLLCAIKENPYQGCAVLETISGNDASPQSAKRMLDEALEVSGSSENICNWLSDNYFDYAAVADQMPSFYAFRERALHVLSQIRNAP